MTSGWIALLDDLTTLTKVAASTLDDVGAQAAKTGSKAVAASLDDAAAQAAKAGSKAAGIVIDDAAVTPRYVVGLAAARELPIIAKIAVGSLKNKLLILLPGALLLSALAPWAITPLLMAGGAFLCLEGYHKVMDLVRPGHGHHDESASVAQTAEELENERVSSAIRTDFILSAEIMAITLASVTDSPAWLQAVVLGVVGAGMTLLVYGAVALIVKADDAGVALARFSHGLVSALGRGIVLGMPVFLKILSFVGMLAMLWVGGGILIHGLHALGAHGPEEMVHHASEAVAHAVPAALQSFLSWLTGAAIAGVLGVVIGALVDPLANFVLIPVFKAVKGMFGKMSKA
jgi:predicted DNA repair protein MutK